MTFEETRTELESILGDSKGNNLFFDALQRTRSPEEFLGVLVNYVEYANLFASCIAGFVRVITDRQNLYLFCDPSEPLRNLWHKNADVAECVFEALVDEFGDRSLPDHPNHISLSWATVIGACQHFRVDSKILDSSLFRLQDRRRRDRRAPYIGSFAEALRRSYCCGLWISNRRILQGIGFHFASESLATGEFDALQNFMEHRYPDLVDYLKKTDVMVAGEHCLAYHWVQVHAGQSGVEVEHAAAALEAVRRGMDYVNRYLKDYAEEFILEGANRFSLLHAKFMENV